jgi:hypothetical protein
VSLIQKFRNVRLTMYSSVISLFLFTATIINAIFYAKKLIAIKEIAEIHYFIGVGFGLMVLFNLPYKINLYQN